MMIMMMMMILMMMMMIRLRREEGRVCGRDSALCEGAPSVEVCGQCGLLFDVSFPLGVHDWPSL